MAAEKKISSNEDASKREQIETYSAFLSYDKLRGWKAPLSLTVHNLCARPPCQQRALKIAKAIMSI